VRSPVQARRRILTSSQGALGSNFFRVWYGCAQRVGGMVLTARGRQPGGWVCQQAGGYGLEVGCVMYHTIPRKKSEPSKASSKESLFNGQTPAQAQNRHLAVGALKREAVGKETCALRVCSFVESQNKENSERTERTVNAHRASAAPCWRAPCLP